MQYWCTGVAVFLVSGCLDPLVDDAPGYSWRVLPEGTRVPKAAADYELNHKIDQDDALEAGELAPSQGFAAGTPVRYWDLGAAKATIAPAYLLTRCDGAGKPIEGGALPHLLLVDSVPGDADYTPFRSLNMTCVRPTYAGELITSLEALSDAIDLGILDEPSAPQRWVNYPVVAAGVKFKTAVFPALYRGAQIEHLSFMSHEGTFAFADKRIKAANVYEVVRDGSDAVERVVFAQALLDAHGKPNPRYAPAWRVVTVTISEDADIEAFTREEDLVLVAEDGTLTAAREAVLSAMPTGSTVNRPHQRAELRP
jgi:hypothetical protein